MTSRSVLIFSSNIASALVMGNGLDVKSQSIDKLSMSLLIPSRYSVRDRLSRVHEEPIGFNGAVLRSPLPPRYYASAYGQTVLD